MTGVGFNSAIWFTSPLTPCLSPVLVCVLILRLFPSPPPRSCSQISRFPDRREDGGLRGRLMLIRAGSRGALGRDGRRRSHHTEISICDVHWVHSDCFKTRWNEAVQIFKGAGRIIYGIASDLNGYCSPNSHSGCRIEDTQQERAQLSVVKLLASMVAILRWTSSAIHNKISTTQRKQVATQLN